MKRLRIVVAGAGAIGQRHIELVTRDPRCELAAVIDPAPDVAEITVGAGV
jgi:predicted dehydrogenase